MKYYLVGIKGSGMSSLAILLKGLGHEVQGADVSQHIFTQDNIIKNNIVIDSLDTMNYKDSDIIVLGNSFIDKYNFNDKKVLSYQQIIAEIEKYYISIAVCGTHGKTTTTNMIKKVLTDLSPVTYLIGDGQGNGVVNSKYFVYEACEHRDHFLTYYPDIIVCSNIDFDHVEYFNDIKTYKKSFLDFFTHAQDKVIINIDDVDDSMNDYITYGYDKAMIHVNNTKFSKNGVSFDLIINKKEYKNITLPIYGTAIFKDALACIACCTYLNIPLNFIINSLKYYQNANRRFNEEIFKSNVIIDDYGHHPTEIKATIEAINNKYPTKKIVLIYHPDRPKRLLTFKNQFDEVFKSVSKCFILPFINMDVEKQKAFDTILKEGLIKPFDDSFYNVEYKDTVFLFTGSKEMKNEICKLKKSINNN